MKFTIVEESEDDQVIIKRPKQSKEKGVVRDEDAELETKITFGEESPELKPEPTKEILPEPPSPTASTGSSSRDPDEDDYMEEVESYPNYINQQELPKKPKKSKVKASKAPKPKPQKTRKRINLEYPFFNPDSPPVPSPPQASNTPPSNTPQSITPREEK